jgi:crossover junction endodeoxyribonuclease RuvC
MPTGQAAGVALLVAAEHGLPVVAYSPNEVKQTVTGDGRADKQAVARLVAAQLGLDAPPRPGRRDRRAGRRHHAPRAQPWCGRRRPSRPRRVRPLEAAAAGGPRGPRGGWEAVVAAHVGGGPRRGDAA